MTTEASRFAGGLFDPLQASLPDVVTPVDTSGPWSTYRRPFGRLR
jgi:hypothetical protein